MADLMNMMGCLRGRAAGMCLGEGHFCEGYKCVKKKVVESAILFGSKAIAEAGSCLLQ